jgi:photoactive yellow protein
MSFVSEDLLQRVASLSSEEIDDLPFGTACIDDTGVVTLLNSYGAELSKTGAEEAKGKNFFLQLAPCTNNTMFRGKFEVGVASESLNCDFHYTFTLRVRPTNVHVHLFRHNDTSTNWIFTQRR